MNSFVLFFFMRQTLFHVSHTLVCEFTGITIQNTEKFKEMQKEPSQRTQFLDRSLHTGG